MPAKTVRDVPDDRFIHYGNCKYEEGDGWEAYFVDADGCALFDDGWIRINLQADPWMVDQACAENGWGPLFYDLAIEFATGHSNGVRPHFRNVSDEAYAVWKKYFHERQDVAHTRLDDASPWAHDEETRPELRYIYTKQNPVVIIELSELNKRWQRPTVH